MEVTLTAQDAAATTYTLVDASSPWKLVAWDWGNAIWEQQYSGARGTLGARPSHSTVANRPVAIGLRLLPASKAAMPGHLADLGNVLELMRRYGGRVTVTTANVPYEQHLVVLSGSATLANWTNRAEWAGRVDYAVTFTCEPYVRGASMEVLDGFASDTTGDYTYDDGAATDVAVSAGELTPVNPATAVTAIHTAIGYGYGDVRVGVTGAVGTTLSGFKAGVVLKRTGDGTHLEVYVDDNGANSRLRIDKVVGGARTNLATTNLGARVAAGQRFRVLGYIAGNTVDAEYYLGFIAGAEYARSANTTTSTILTSTDVTAFGHAVTGQCGWVWTAQQASARLADFAISPFAYRRASGQAAGHIVMRGEIPGDAPAVADVEVVADVGLASAPRETVFAFAKQPVSRNLLSDGSFDLGASGTVARPWVVSAVSGVTGAATSISYTTPPRFGSACAQIVCPATANTGASAAMYGPFYAGVTYTANVWCRAASATTNTRLRLGVSGDISSSTAAALSTTWTQKTVTWTPTATVLVAYIACEITAATGTTWQIDAAEVYEGTTAPTAQIHGRGGRPCSALLVPDEAHTLTGFAVSADSSWPYIAGSKLRVSSGTTATAKWRLDPTLIDPSHHTGSVEMEVWAWVDAPDTTWTSPRIIPSLRGGDVGQSTYTREYGSTGVAGGSAGSEGLMRLGTLAVPVVAQSQVDLVLTFTHSAISGNLDVPFVILVPPHRRFLVPSGSTLMPTPSSGSPTAAQVLSDGLVRVKTYLELGWSASPGVGQTITPDPGLCELIYCFEGATNGSEATISVVRFTPTPRWHHLRDA